MSCNGRTTQSVTKESVWVSMSLWAKESLGECSMRRMRFPFPEKPDLDFSWKLLSTKSKVWEYESEWRVFLELKEGVWNERAGRVLYFADFGSELVLQEVILGAASKTSDSDVLQAMQGYGDGVRVSRMRLSCDKFELQEYPVNLVLVDLPADSN